MDLAKCRALKAELAAQPEPQVISIARFFDGNDDLGSIGCNLEPHPGVDAFRCVLVGLLERPDVRAVYARISELDAGEECWPFTDRILVVGRISTDELRRAVSALEPDEVGAEGEAGVSPSLAERHGVPVSFVWWD